MAQQRESKKPHSCILPPVQVRVLILAPNDEEQRGAAGTTGHAHAAMGLFGMGLGWNLGEGRLLVALFALGGERVGRN